MRGKLLEGHERLHHVRIIPAHAGQTRRWHSDADSQSDHPRACGANSQSIVSLSRPLGSSPRMRGKPNPGCHDARGFRIIPAHAGQTSSPDLNWASTTDHPRACGANFRRSPIARSTAGSSPRMRGKRVRRRQGRDRERIIPAHAGQTLSTNICMTSKPDHPRACGANSL